MKRFASDFLFLVAVLLALAIGVWGSGCATGTSQTSAGPRPAAAVQAQDAIADVLQVANDTYNSAVAKHDSTPICSVSPVPACETDAVHAAHRAVLLKVAHGLRISYGGLIAWKEAQDTTTARKAFCELQGDLPDFEALVVQFGILKQPDVDRWGPIVSSAINQAGGCS